MKAFISWSGERSKLLAEQLNNWLPKVVQSLDPWMSAEDIRAGGRWLVEIGRQLEQAGFGIICLTQDNLEERWIHFEAGSLGKELETASVCPYLLGIEPADVSGPLAQFQAKRANKEGTFALLQAMNNRIAAEQPTSALSDALLKEAFEKWWPDLEAQIKAIPESQENPPQRGVGEKIDEILELVRQIAQRPTDTVLKISRLPAFRDFIHLRRAALAGFMQQGARLRRRGDVLTVIPLNDIYVRYLTDNASLLTELASEFFRRPMTVEIATVEPEVPEPDE